jgi:hypothetical protein
MTPKITQVILLHWILFAPCTVLSAQNSGIPATINRVLNKLAECVKNGVDPSRKRLKALL